MCDSCAAHEERLRVAASYGQSLLEEVAAQKRTLEQLQCEVLRERGAAQEAAVRAHKARAENEQLRAELSSAEARVATLEAQLEAARAAENAQLAKRRAQSEEEREQRAADREHVEEAQQRAKESERKMKEAAKRMQAAEEALLRDAEDARAQRDEAETQLAATKQELSAARIETEDARREADELKTAFERFVMQIQHKQQQEEEKLQHQKEEERDELRESGGRDANNNNNNSNNNSNNKPSESNPTLSTTPRSASTLHDELSPSKKRSSVVSPTVVEVMSLEAYVAMCVAAIKTAMQLQHPQLARACAMVSPRVVYMQLLCENVPFHEAHDWIKAYMYQEVVAAASALPPQQTRVIREIGTSSNTNVDDRNSSVNSPSGRRKVSFWDSLFSGKKKQPLGNVCGTLLKFEDVANRWVPRFIMCGEKALRWSDTEKTATQIMGEVPFASIKSLMQSDSRPLSFVITTSDNKRHVFAADDAATFVMWMNLLAKYA